jgi:hypothetical protein
VLITIILDITAPLSRWHHTPNYQRTKTQIYITFEITISMLCFTFHTIVGMFQAGHISFSESGVIIDHFKRKRHLQIVTHCVTINHSISSCGHVNYTTYDA